MYLNKITMYYITLIKYKSQYIGLYYQINLHPKSSVLGLFQPCWDFLFLRPVCPVWFAVSPNLAPQRPRSLPSSSSCTGLQPSLVLSGRQWDQAALAVALLPVLLLVLEVQYDPSDLLVIRGGRATLLLHVSGLLLLAPLYRRGHYVIKEGEEAIDPIRALLS